MANKPIVQIGVDDTEFRKFTELFNDFNAKLDAMPEAWQKLNAAMGGAGDAGNALASGALTAKEAIALAGAQAAIIAEALTEAVKASDSLGDSTHGANKRMGELAKTVKGLGGDIAGIGKWVLRLGSGALAGLGLGALVGGFGIGELANVAFNRSRTAGGLGLSPGQLASFGVNAQPYLSQGALEAAASAQLTYQSAPYLRMLGIDFNRAQTMNAADLAFEELRGAVRNWQDAQKSGTPPASSPFVKAYEELGGNLEDVRRAALAGIPAVNAAQAGYRRDVGVLGFDRQTADAWTKFKVQLDRAGMQIENVFITKLGPLIPQFTELSKDFINAIAGFVNSKDFGDIMGRIKDGLKSFVSWVEGPDPKKLWDGIALVGSEVMAVADKLKWLLPQPADKNFPSGIAGHTAQGDFKWLQEQMKGWGKKADKAGSWGLLGDALGSGWNWVKSLPQKAIDALQTPQGIHTLNTIASGVTGVPVKILDRLSLDESNYGDKRWLTSSAGAQGIDQLMPGTAQQLGVTDVNNPAQNVAAGAKYLKQMFAKYHDWGKAVAAYNLGPGALDDILSRHAKDWIRYVPAETRGEVSNVYGSHAATSDAVLRKLLNMERKKTAKPVHVSITNATSARVAISANAVAAG